VSPNITSQPSSSAPRFAEVDDALALDLNDARANRGDGIPTLGDDRRVELGAQIVEARLKRQGADNGRVLALFFVAPRVIDVAVFSMRCAFRWCVPRLQIRYTSVRIRSAPPSRNHGAWYVVIRRWPRLASFFDSSAKASGFVKTLAPTLPAFTPKARLRSSARMPSGCFMTIATR